MPVPHYPSDEPEEESPPDIDSIIHQIIDGTGERDRGPSPSLGS
ncbi:hypothetical protein [Halospeciosus flavus]|uniref:Uncharacterized protein n=1 Tax=Halospeciosus flavus TaxID=3032283 RepID=A0ABD5Z569_9EURY|nr:hypothetical protein [Halospeciosus flavus]